MKIPACRHKKLSRVFTPRGGGGSHVVCFSCSQSFEYDLKAMRMGARIVPAEPVRSIAASRELHGA